MNKNGKEKIKSEQNISQVKTRTGKFDIHFLFAILFVFSFLYFYLFGNYVFFYQENLSLFVFSSEYLQQFAVKPGGFLEYAGNFFTQGYFNSVYGSIILSAIFTLLAIVFLKINKRLFPDRSYSLPFIVLPSCLLLLMQTNFNYLIHNNLGFLVVALYFLFSISSERKSFRIFVMAFFPLFYYFVGAYAWIYLGMYFIYSLINKKVIYPFVLLIIASLSFLLVKEVLFLQPIDELLCYPLLLKDYFKNPVFIYLLYGFIVFYPLLLKATYLIKIKKEHTRTLTTYSVLVIFSLTIFFQSRLYNPGTADLFKLEKLLYEQDWNGVIKHQETSQSANLVAQYYYNIALSEKDMLCDRMFYGRQNFGTQSIIIPWDSQTSINKIFRGVYFFYTIGLINEAHRWAFESMVIQGYRPENIKLLIKTDLINGHYKMAEKYIYVLKRTLHYRSWAKKYEEMLYHPEMIQSDPELGEKIKLQTKVDFPIRIKNPQSNVILLLQSNPNNKKAFEYKLAWFMLEKNVGGIVNEINKMKGMGYTRIPRHIEEVALFSNANIGPLPDLGGLKISPETESRYSQYESSLMYIDRNKSSGSSEIQKSMRNTFWYYLDLK